MESDFGAAPAPEAPKFCAQCGRRLPPGDNLYCAYCGTGVQLRDVPVVETAPRKFRTPWGYADMAMAIGVVIGGTILIGAPAAVIAVIVAGGTDLNDNVAATAVLLGANAFIELVLLGSVALFAVRKYKVSWAMVGVRMPRRGLAALLAPFLNGVTPRKLREAIERMYTDLPDRIRKVITILDRASLGLALLFGALVVVWTYFTILFALGIEADSNIPEEAFDSVPLVALVALLSLVLAPIMEETFFRGFLFGGLRGRWGVFFAALASGFLFSLAHIDPLVYVPFTLVGMVFAWGYVYSGSIFSSMIAHLLFNAVSFSLALSGVAD